MTDASRHTSPTEPSVIVATWFGAGLLPKAPGTWGSLAALPFVWVLHTLSGWPGLAGAIAACVLIGVWASNGYLAALGGEDPAPVVIDEVAGMWLTLLPAAFLMPDDPDWIIYAIGFALFRVADIFKPWPASWADRNIKGGLGIMLDDLLAAVYAALALAGVITWGGF